uniref:DNA mismatch repair protein n=1 Tax=Actinia equina TaxID=6106 RepID=A0A6C0WVY8_ACTEQ|nr:DNA mismatch repair protein Msh6-like protein [Actinia equina]
MATLFSYFTKTPKRTSPQTADKAEGAKENKTPPSSAQGVASENGKYGVSTPCGVSNTQWKKNTANATFKCFDIVWAKMEGHPWWPSIICKHPTHDKYLKDKKYHVQFFGEPPSRGWVNVKQVEPFVKGQKKGNGDPSIKKAVIEADRASQMNTSKREELIKCVPSDEEDENDDGEQMEVESDKDDTDDEDDVVTRRKNQFKSRQPQRKATMKARHQKKKRYIIESGSEDSESDEFVPENSETSDDDSVSSGVDEKDDDEFDEPMSEDEKPKSSRKRKRGSSSTSHPKSKKLMNGNSSPHMPCTNKTPVKPMSSSSSVVLPASLANKVSNSATKAASLLSKFQMTSSPSTSSEKKTDKDNGNGFAHERLEWLKEQKRKDKHGRPMSHPDYDPKTLLVPASFLSSKEVTPAMKQWWTLKSENFDTVLFFKIGKFYELYHTDAVIGVKELNLIYMKGNFAHAGFPEIAYDRYSDTLIQKGYKVARVEQTETPEMMKERCRKERTNSKYDQVVKREICAVTTKGTKMYSFRDGDCTDTEAAYLLAIKEKGYDDTVGGGSVYGVCFLDTSIGKFHLGQFEDDRQASRLRTLIARHTPVQVLIPRGGLTSKTQHVLSHELMSTITEQLAPGSEFWDSSKTLKFLAEGTFFQQNKMDVESVVWPDLLKEMTSGDPHCLTAADDSELAISALGSVVWYLKRCLIEEELLSMGKFEKYQPLDCMQDYSKNEVKFAEGRQHLILDDVSLSNLDILPCGPDTSTEGTLLDRLDYCSTAFGKRLFKQWLCAPLCNPSAINDRLNAVEDLMTMPAAMADVKDILKALPDLERLLRKIHSMGSNSRAHNHPDGRAILYNEDTYSKRKITDFLSTLEGFSNACSIVSVFKDSAENFKSKILCQVVCYEERKGKGRFPHLENNLKFFKNAFDHAKAKKDGVIVPKPGVNEPYDEALDDIKAGKSWFDQYLDKQRKRLNCRSVVYFGSAKNRYQLEVPDSALGKNTPDDYTLQSQRKGFRRYWTSEIEEHLADLMDAEDRRDVALKDTMRTIFQSFDEHYDMWDKAVQCLAVLDALVSLATYSSHGDGPMCRPEVVLPEVSCDGDIQPFLEIREGRHPCISRTFSGGDFIPNHTVVGIVDNEDESGSVSTDNALSTCVLVTGPNMGGKSTLMRQAGLITVMAQLGCYVPAEKCRLTPVDRVFTRLGAHDRIMAGESTFFVELSETSTILRHATRNSLVLVDELGRGTATFDGTAIACAVVRELSSNIRCRTLFSTHYHSLVEEFAGDPNVRLGHMACMVENDDEEGDPSKETITFLYKFVKGDCPKSYGFNAARLAGIPDEIISLAVHKSREFEETLDQIKLFKRFIGNACDSSSIKNYLNIVKKLKK